MTVVFERPYQFVPPIRSTWWPWLIQRLRLYDRYLKRKEGVVDYELRQIDWLKQSVDADHGVLLAPNHCRYADPLVLGWPARHLGIHVHAMASWHLFNEGKFDAFAIRRMGGFSVFREGNDRQSLETAIDILVDGGRPLIVFPEGTTNRTNDQLKPLLDGVAFIARTAAKRRIKRHTESGGRDFGSGRVVVHPVGIKYLCLEPIDDWAHRQLDDFEKRLGWKLMPRRELLPRTLQLAEALLTLREVQYLGRSQGGDLPDRRDALIEHVLTATEAAMKLSQPGDDVRDRVRQIRSIALTRYFENHPDPQLEQQLRRHVMAADFAQDLSSYPTEYLMPEQATDTRVVETIQRMQESVYGKADHSIPLKAVIRFDAAIEVDTARPPRGVRDPLMQQLEDRLTTMIGELSGEARPLGVC
jgi:1-acyl-sn-glycerol-3-phosphate acyltransferase